MRIGRSISRFICHTGLLILRQEPGQVRVTIVESEDGGSVSADRFENLPEEAKSRIFEIWKTLGIQPPLSFSDQAVAVAALEKLEALENDDELVLGLLADLEAEDTQQNKLKPNRN